MKTRFFVKACSLVLLLSGAGSFLSAATPETPEAYQQRMKWWNDGRLGMFLHWGVYSVFGGEYNGTDYGKEMGGASAEWIYLMADIPEAEYRKAALAFNPQKFDPKAWVRIAQAAGMKYIVLTAKHHDGFALFDTQASDWNAVKASGGRRDLIKAYVDACHELGMRVGFYYSHEKDWFHHAKLAKAPGPLPEGYAALAKQEITELLTHYGQIDVIWFDTPSQEHEEFNRTCAGLVRKYQPNCIINGRIGNGLGDYKNIGDRAIVDPGQQGYMESIMTMRLNWGYDRNDNFWKSSDDLIRMVSTSACRGSNFLLNIGPTPEGTFPVEDQVRMRALGDWMARNGESIYQTSGSPFAKEHKWGSISVNKDTHSIYLHLWNWTGGKITVHGITSRVTRAAFLDTAEAIEVSQDRDATSLTVALPEVNTAQRMRVVKLAMEDLHFDLAKGPDFVAPQIAQVNHQLIKGALETSDGVAFTMKQGKAVLALRLNDHVRFRLNTKGDIRQVPGFDLEKGKKYEVVYSPYKKGPEVEIVTRVVE